MKSQFEKFQRLRLFFITIAVAIVLGAGIFTQVLVGKLSAEEQRKMEIWAKATQLLVTSDAESDMTLVLEVIQANTTIPVIVVDENNVVIEHRNVIDSVSLANLEDKETFFNKEIMEYRQAHHPLPVVIDSETTYYVVFDESSLITFLSMFSYVLLAVVSLFLVLAFIAFTGTRKAEQNQVWVGLSKETAHQLGTPISSLLAWIEILKSKNLDQSLIKEMGKDINRLRIIAERFSKIGSKPELEPVLMKEVLENAVMYIRNRTSNKVVIDIAYQIRQDTLVKLNVSLFEWVVENLCKNAIDAMDGDGRIDIFVTDQSDRWGIDIKDTGKGIPKSKFNTVFNPGYTTKKRGWGLGLSLVKRIIEEYHAGKIFVKQSEIDKGTTFRILLKKDIS